MKNTPLKLFTVLLLFAICSCNKNQCTTYTVSGTLINGETGQPYIDSGSYLVLQESQDLDANQPGFNVSTKPDKNGNFSFSYSVCGYSQQELTIGLHTPNTNYVLIDPYDSISGIQIPFQQNINRTWYVATKGWIVLRLQPLSPLLPGDTLFVNFYYNNTLKVFTILSTQNGVLDSTYINAGDYTLNWGRGKKNQYKYDHEGLVGDPKISQYTIKY